MASGGVVRYPPVFYGEGRGITRMTGKSTPVTCFRRSVSAGAGEWLFSRWKGDTDMDTDIIKADTLEEYGRIFGVETRHPQVGVVRFDRSENQPTHRMTLGFYALFLVKTVGITIDYGKTRYDFDDGTVICFAPGQTIGISRMAGGSVPEAVGLLFHPDFLRGTALGAGMGRFTFFSYASHEALCLSAEERRVVEDYLGMIGRELERPVDGYSKSLVALNIEVLLNYCLRFYGRQFATREALGDDVLARFERLLDGYWEAGRPRGLPTVRYFADKVCLSPNYFGDLVKARTGLTAQEHVQRKLTEAAKDALLKPRLSVKQVAELLGFRYPQHFLRFFKRNTGLTPREYRDGGR